MNRRDTDQGDGARQRPASFRRDLPGLGALPVVLAVGVALVLAGCGGSGNSSSSESAGASNANASKPAGSTSSTTGPPLETQLQTDGHISGKPLHCGTTKLGDDPCQLPKAIPTGKSVKIGFFGLSNNSYQLANWKGIQAVAKDNGAEAEEQLNAFNPTEQISQLQDALTAHKYDAYVVEPVNAAATRPLFEKMASEKIPYATMVLPSGPGQSGETSKTLLPGQTIQMLKPPVLVGEQLGQVTEKACTLAKANPCEVGLIRGSALLELDKDETKGFERQVGSSKNPVIKIVATGYGEYLQPPSRKVAQDMLTAHSNLNVIATLGDNMSQGVVEALESAGKKGQVEVASRGASELGLKQLRNHEAVGSDLTVPFNEGYVGAYALIAKLRGLKFPALGINSMTTRGTVPEVPTIDNEPEWKGFKGQWTGS